MAQRIIILGVTGVDKKTAIKNLLDFFGERHAEEDIPVVVDFERDYLKKRGPLHRFLSQSEDIQWTLWEEAWNNFIKDHGNPEKNVILSLHGAIVNRMYGFRIPISYGRLQEWEPTKVVTLIDDVYLSWFRTEKRAQELDWRGRPTIEQLLTARRAEAAVGDAIVRYCTGNKYAKNSILAVRHPARVLYRLLFGTGDLIPIYVSFPISGPRKLEASGAHDAHEGIEEVNAFMRQVLDFEIKHPNTCCFCPLTIDELPLQRLLRDFNRGESAVSAPPVKMDVHTLLERRWDVREFWKTETLLCDDSTFQDPAFDEIELDPGPVEDVLGLVRTDVGYRDFRLVIQSQRLAVFNPRFRGEKARGVDAEIACAKLHTIPFHVYQDPKDDPDGITKIEIEGTEGSLGHNPRQEFGKMHDNLETLFGQLPE